MWPMAKITIDSRTEEFEGTVLDHLLSEGINPDSYIFLIDGVPIPSDTCPPADSTVMAVRVASGG